MMMSSSSAHAASEDRRVRLLGAAGLGLLRYGLIFILVMSGSLTCLAFAVEGIEPLGSNSPLLAWLYPLFGFRGTSALIGVVEVGVGVLIAMWRWLPAVSGYASLVASGIFVVTLSFLFTIPGARSPTQIQALAGGAYIERAEPVVFIGECGTGKTHLLAGLCVAASRAGGDRS